MAQPLNKPRQPSTPEPFSPGTRKPRHYHLLWDEELETLQPYLQIVFERLDEVVSHWYKLYELHFGEERSLSEHEFHDIFHSALASSTRDLLKSNMDRYTTGTIHTGELLAERKVPFSEVVASLHLFEESAYQVFPDSPPPPLSIYTTFDKLSHIRMMLLADAYFRSVAAEAGARIQRLEKEAARIPDGERQSFHGLIGATPVMRQLYVRIEASGRTRGNVLIVGESGTGKELVARAIHECADHPGPFVALNCAALPKDLIESELFGYKRGAFSGANSEYLGLFRAAEDGTLFLDEITEMGPETQSKLLRTIQERTVRPVGATRETPVNARLIASTNRDPQEAARSGQLRQDLYYRLQANVINVPPLRERPEDIPPLIDHFIALFNQKLAPKIPVRGIETDAIGAMRNYDWPGNVRELSNAIEGAFTFGQSAIIRLADLPPAISGRRSQVPTNVNPLPIGTFAAAEREIICRALESTGGNKLAASKLLGISRKKLYAKIERYGL
jgi:DNA-binding NtrC family response regulator